MNDDAVQRAIRIRNLQAMDQLYAPQWKAKQRATYINSIPITPDQDLGQILSENMQHTFKNPQLARGELFSRLYI